MDSSSEDRGAKIGSRFPAWLVLRDTWMKVFKVHKRQGCEVLAPRAEGRTAFGPRRGSIVLCLIFIVSPIIWERGFAFLDAVFDVLKLLNYGELDVDVCVDSGVFISYKSCFYEPMVHFIPYPFRRSHSPSSSGAVSYQNDFPLN